MRIPRFRDSACEIPCKSKLSKLHSCDSAQRELQGPSKRSRVCHLFQMHVVSSSHLKRMYLVQAEGCVQREHRNVCSTAARTSHASEEVAAAGLESPRCCTPLIRALCFGPVRVTLAGRTRPAEYGPLHLLRPLGRASSMQPCATAALRTAALLPYARRRCCLTHGGAAALRTAALLPYARRRCCLTHGGAAALRTVALLPYARRRCCLTHGGAGSCSTTRGAKATAAAMRGGDPAADGAAATSNNAALFAAVQLAAIVVLWACDCATSLTVSDVPAVPLRDRRSHHQYRSRKSLNILSTSTADSNSLPRNVNF
jgi:hypothetical protein